MTHGWFITGTDTGVGKSWLADALLLALRDIGRRAVGMKPVASGCSMTPAGLRSEDAERLLAAGVGAAGYEDVNPYAFEPPIAPHLAAARVGVEMRLETILRHFERLRAMADVVVVEGVGGWRVPFNRTLLMSDVARALDLPVVLVVGLKLGCVNHALLTADALRADGLAAAGWIANRVDPAFDAWEETTAALDARLPMPRLGVVPAEATAEQRRCGAALLARLI